MIKGDTEGGVLAGLLFRVHIGRPSPCQNPSTATLGTKHHTEVHTLTFVYQGQAHKRT